MHRIKLIANTYTDGKISVLEREIGVSSSRLDKIVKSKNAKLNHPILTGTS